MPSTMSTKPTAAGVRTTRARAKAAAAAADLADDDLSGREMYLRRRKAAEGAAPEMVAEAQGGGGRLFQVRPE